MRQIVECAPNFSEGRRDDVIGAIAAAVEACGVQLLDISADPDLNRCVISFVGEISEVERAAFAAAQQASEAIDMSEHQGEHPRIGATDVVPFVPVAGVSLGDCVALARRVGERIGRELQIPVYLYGEAATNPDREPISAIRRHEYEDLRDSIETDSDLAPDFGPRSIGSAGATAVGARHAFVPINFYLATDREEVADAVSRAVREASGGLTHVDADSVTVPDQGMVAVAATLRRPDETPLHRLAELVRSEAGRFGVSVLSSEIHGYVPQSVLLRAAEWYLQLEDLAPEQVLESRLVALMAAQGESSRAPQDFLDSLAAEAPSPGGQAAAALVAAMAAALSRMVANLTIGRDAFAAVDADMRRLRDRSTDLQQELLAILQQEESAHEDVAKAFERPKSTPEESDLRREAIQAALRRMTDTSLTTARHSVEVMQLARQAAELGNAKAASEAGMAGFLAQASVSCSALNVRVCVRGLRDLEEGDRYRRAGQELVREADSLAGDIDRVVQGRIAG
jgi:glutamate formiminotransferase/formiminotetrahydrofolate cyclodeaminase